MYKTTEQIDGPVKAGGIRIDPNRNSDKKVLNFTKLEKIEETFVYAKYLPLPPCHFVLLRICFNSNNNNLNHHM